MGANEVRASGPSAAQFRRLARDETGSTLILIIFYAFLGLALVLIVTAASSLYLERKRLFSLADAAALIAAESYELDAVALTPLGPRPVLDEAVVASAVADYLVAVPNDFEGLEVDRAATDDGRSAIVGLSSYWRPPIVTLFVPDGLRISVEAKARSVFG